MLNDEQSRCKIFEDENNRKQKNKKINNPQMPNVTTPRRLSVALYPVVHEHNWPSTAHVRPQRRTFIG